LGLRGGGADAHLAERDGWCLGRWAARRLLMLSPSSVSSSSPVPTPQSLFFFDTVPSPHPTEHARRTQPSPSRWRWGGGVRAYGDREAGTRSGRRSEGRRRRWRADEPRRGGDDDARV
jgi:hypothetical protein